MSKKATNVMTKIGKMKCARKDEETKDKLDYQAKDLTITSIIIEGDALTHAYYDSAMVALHR